MIDDKFADTFCIYNDRMLNKDKKKNGWVNSPKNSKELEIRLYMYSCAERS